MKKIRSSADLAINGADPAFTKPLHVGRPNTGDREAFIRRVNGIFDRGWLTNDGPEVREFEKRIAGYVGVKHCIAMCNATVALEIAIRSLDLHGEVIVPSYTFIATAHALQWQEITPVFADIDPETHNLDPEAVRNMITPRTTGIIGVHLWGRAAPVEALARIAEEHGLKLMFDAAHAFGCSHGGRMIGRFGACEVLSFHATKFFNTFEGGAIVTDDDELAEKTRLMRNFGFAGYDDVIYPGTNGKMTEVCAAMGLTNLDSLDDSISANRRNLAAYRHGLQNLPHISMIRYDEAEKNNYHYAVIEIGIGSPITRDALVSVLHAENVLARRYFWPGCHRMKPYRDLYPEAGVRLGRTEEVSGRVIVLPNGRATDEEDVNTICEIIACASAPK